MSGGLHEAQEDRGAVWLRGVITSLCTPVAASGVPLMVVLGLFGCATGRSPVLQPGESKQVAAAPAGPAYATVAAVRPIRVFAETENDPQAAILAAIGVPESAAATGGASSEVVVRTTGGETLSVVQPNSTDLAPGERVMILRGGLPRLLPVPHPGG